MHKGRETVGMTGPEGEGVGRPGRESKMMRKAAANLAEDFGADHRLGPDQWRMHNGKGGTKESFFLELVAVTGDFGIEGFDADAELAG